MTYFKPLTMLSLLFVSACSMTRLTSKIHFEDKMPHLSCIKRAIELVDLVKFHEERVHESNSICILGDCLKKSFYVHYKVKKNPNFMATIILSKSRSNRLKIEHYFYDRYRTLDKNNEKIIQEALDKVSHQISRQCGS